MDINTLKSAVFSSGFVEDFIEQYHASIPEDAPESIKKQADELLASWQRVDEAFRILKREAGEMQMKLSLVNQAIR